MVEIFDELAEGFAGGGDVVVEPAFHGEEVDLFSAGEFADVFDDLDGFGSACRLRWWEKFDKRPFSSYRETTID